MRTRYSAWSLLAAARSGHKDWAPAWREAEPKPRYDVGLDRGVAKKAANLVGRRSLLWPVDTDSERMQLVGLLPLDRRTRLPVGAHMTLQAPPAAIEGFVTSSAFSPVLGHPVALAMLKRGSQRVGERITAYHLGRPIEAEVVKTPFFDAAGVRVSG